MNELLPSSGPLSSQFRINPAEKAGVSPQEFTVAILLVSEDGQFLSTLSRALEKFNARSFPAFNHEQAEKQVHAAKFDAIIVDFEDVALATRVLRVMRESKMNRASMIIAVADNPANGREAFKCGASLTIPRLQTTDQLTRCLRSSYYLVLRNKRASIRFPLDKEIRILRGEQPVMEGRITNLSESGLKLICQPILEKGAVLEVAFQLPNAANIKAKIRVMWSEESGEAGAQFAKIEDEGLKGIQEWINTSLFGRLT